MKQLSTIVFVVAFLGWAWLEFVARDTQNGLQDILFWVGMGTVLVHSWDGNRRRSAT
jgi:predicted permease